MSMNQALMKIRMQVMWNRLISVVEEQAQTLVRTAFSTSVREAGDLAAAVFDRQGRMLAQAVTGTPGHINAMAEAIVHFIGKYPVESMEPGDVFITNDPWKTSGHLHDITVVTPTFHRGKAVALFANTCHVVDIGGRGFGPDARQVYEEGINIPIMHLFRKGEPNETLMEIVRTNVREPMQVVGDIFSFAASNDTGSKRLVAMLEEFGIDDVDELGEFIIESSRAATVERIAKLRNGTFHNALVMDGYDEPVKLQAALTVGDDNIHVELHQGLYLLRGEVRGRTGHPEQLRLAAADHFLGAQGLHPQRAAAVRGRSTPHHRPPAAGHHHGLPAPGRRRWLSGGGLGVSVEHTTARRPVRVASRELRGRHSRVRNAAVQQRRHGRTPAQGRAERHCVSKRCSRYAGGGDRGHHACHLLAQGTALRLRRRRAFARRPRPGHRAGRCGGHPVRRAGDVRARGPSAARPRGRRRLASGTQLRSKGQQSIPAHDRLVLEMAGGGGFGDPHERDARQVAEDVRNGFVSRESARDDYGVVLDAEGQVDEAATAAARGV
jgi:N-methylhydantoinase B